MSSDKVTLMIGVSGVRGIVGETLTPELVTRLGVAFGTYMNSGKIIVGRDTRVSGEMIKHSVLAGLISTGCEVVDLGIVTTPTCSLMVRELKAAGAVIITGSHNPIEWNALKFLKSNGIFLNDEEGKQLLNIYYQGAFKKMGWAGLHTVTEDNTAADRHIKKVLANIKVGLIQEQKFKVVLDSCNGAGAIITPLFLKELGCEVIPIHCEPNGLFPHNPEPIFINLQELCRTVKKEKADIGFAQDPDADRVAIVDANGHYLGEEYSVSLAANYILKKNRGGAIAVNVVTSMVIDDIAKKHHARLIRTKVGEVHVAEAMIAEMAVIGGEGNGGVMWPKVHPVRDSLVGIALTLQNMAENRKSIKQLAEELPVYHIVKEKIDCPMKDSHKVMDLVKGYYRKEKIVTTDGLMIDKNGARITVRPSNTEPIFRIFVESDSHSKSLKMALDIKKTIAGMLKKINH